jgi:hypothetical protein
MRKLIAASILLALAFNAAAFDPSAQLSCGSFDTDHLRADMAAPHRTDREWYETLIKILAWQLDCERRNALERGAAPKRKPAPWRGLFVPAPCAHACGTALAARRTL